MVTRTATTLVILTTLYLSTSHPLEENYLSNIHATNDLNNLRRSDLQSYDTNDTIQKVEEILKNDPSLPRLTRGEILEIIENLTSTTEKHRDEKAVMLVLPYTANNTNNGEIQELFTKAPITKLIGAEPFVVKPFGAKKKTLLKQNSYKNDATLTDIKTTVTSSTTIASVSLSSQEVSLSSQSVTQSPKRKRRPSSTPSSQRFSNHKYPDEKGTQHYEGLRIVEAPKLQTQKNTEQSFVTLPTTLQDSLKDFQEQVHGPISPPQASYRPKLQLTSSPFSLPQRHSVPDLQTKRPARLPDLPSDLKTALNNLNLQSYNVENNREENAYDDHEISQTIPELHNTTSAKGLLNAYHPQTITTTTQLPDISHVADTLTPDMKELLKNFGLLPAPTSKPTGFKEEPIEAGAASADITKDSFMKFKPLPESVPLHSEMEEFLGRFGLGREAKPKRKQKAYQSIPDLPEGMKEVLMEMELVDRRGKKLPPNHIFKPANTPSTSEEELDKLSQLLDIIKELDKLNSTTEEELNKTIDFNRINNLVSSLNNNQLSPIDEQDFALNPLNYDDGLSKNEIKRQENTTVAAETTTSVTTTEESRMPNIKDLEASFGGNADAVLPVVTIPPPTEAPKTGFYYLLDWNSFFDIDDQKGRRVNLRFQPKAGNPKQFLSVTVP